MCVPCSLCLCVPVFVCVFCVFCVCMLLFLAGFAVCMIDCPPTGTVQNAGYGWMEVRTGGGVGGGGGKIQSHVVGDGR